MNKEIKFISPFKKLCITIGNLPTAYIESMSYYEGLTFLVNYLANNVIPAVNNNSEVVKELQDQFIILKEYVDNYFENLDVQEEINNKLDEMADQGILSDIISEYLNSIAIFCYDNVADMKLAQNLKDGSFTQTLGYHSKNDGGKSLYRIRTITNDDVIDEATIIELYDDTLIAELIEINKVNIKQLGAKGNDTDDDTDIIKLALNKFNCIYFPAGTYILNDNVDITKNNLTLYGENNSIIKLTHHNYGFKFTSCNNLCIHDLEFTSPYQHDLDIHSRSVDQIGKFISCSDINIYKCKLYNGCVGFIFINDNNINFYNNICSDFIGWATMFGEDLTGNFGTITNCKIYNNECTGCEDGIKMTGYIKNVMIYNNHCYSNTRDGIDYAGHTASNVSINNNLLNSNTEAGIEFKQLNRTVYAFDNSQTKVFSNVYIYDNSLNSNYTHGITMQLYYDDVNLQDILIKNNKITLGDVSDNGSNAGIRVAACLATTKHAVIVENNFIDGNNHLNAYGMRFDTSQNILVKDNYITEVKNHGIYLPLNNDLLPTGMSPLTKVQYIDIINNTIIADGTSSSTCITCDADSTHTGNLLIKDNKLYNNGYYFFRLELFNSDNVIIGNEDMRIYNSTPTGRTTKNVIYKSSDPITTLCEGWIGKENNSSARYTTYNNITI